MSIMEMSHRSKEFEAINARAEATFKRLLGVGDGYRVLFVQGGASTQFAMVPMNFLTPGATADFLMTGAWAEKAFEEAAALGQAHIAASTKADGYRRVPRADEIRLSPEPAYVHLTSNETIQGIQWPAFPDVGDSAAGRRHEQRHPVAPDRRRQVRPDLRRGTEEPRPVRRDGGAAPRILAGDGQQERPDDAALQHARQEQLPLQHAAELRRLRAEPRPAMDREERRTAGDGGAKRAQGPAPLRSDRRQRRLLPRPRRAGVAVRG